MEDHLIKMSYMGDTFEIRDNGGRRTGIDRRYYSYSGHIPERRSGVERRKLEDRRMVSIFLDFNQEKEYSEKRKVLLQLVC